jgi:DNA-3-methyladenine glycosylase II
MILRVNEITLKNATDHLAQRDPALAMVIEKYGYPPLWAREPGFPALVHIILEQQVSLASAKAAFNRLETHLAGEVTPANFLNINDDTLLKIGFSRQKKIYTRALASAVLNGDFNFDLLPDMPDPILRTYMKSLKGIGDWSVDIYALMCLQRPDVLPKGDIALYESFKVLYALNERPNYDTFEAYAQDWQPYRSIAARILWHFYLCERDNKPRK